MALMILAGGILLLVNSWGSTAKRIRKMELNHQVAALLEEKMAEFETEFSDQPIEAIPDEDNDDFGAKYPNFSWKMKSRELEFPDMSAAIIAEGGADQMMVQMVKSLTEVLKTHVREVQFTIVVKTPKKNLEYSATTYFVDFNKEIAIGL